MSVKNEAAFPEVFTDYYEATGRYDIYSAGGMTLRQWYKGQAIKGLLGNPGGPIQANDKSGWGYCACTRREVVDEASLIADILLAEDAKFAAREAKHE
jgi:hypothetical protein